MTCPTPTYLLFGATVPSGRRRSGNLIDVFTTEADARAAFRQLRLEVGPGAGWAELLGVEGDTARTLCWFGERRADELLIPPAGKPRPSARRRWRRWAYGTVVVSTSVAMWLFVGNADRAGAAVAPHVSRTGLVTVAEGQRAEATAVNDSDGCHRTEIHLIDGEGHAVASGAATVCPSQHLTVAHTPQKKMRLRSVVHMYSVPRAITQPCSHLLEVQDSTTGIASVVVSAP